MRLGRLPLVIGCWLVVLWLPIVVYQAVFAQGQGQYLFDAQSVTGNVVSAPFAVTSSSTTDVQLRITQPETPNLITVWLQLSNDGNLWADKYLVASNVDADVRIITRYQLLGSFGRFRIVATNAEPVVITIIVSNGNRKNPKLVVPTPFETPPPVDPTDTPLPTDTATPVDTATLVPTNTPPGDTATPTNTPLNTATPTPVDTATATPTDTPADTPTVTATPTDTPLIPVATDTPTSTPTHTPTPTPTFTATPQGSCDLTVTPTANGQQNILDGEAAPYNTLGPGDVLCIQTGIHKGLRFKHFKMGTAALPLTIRNNGGVVTVNSLGITAANNAAVIFEYSSHFRFTGTGAPGTTYGFILQGEAQALQLRSRTDHFEIDHLHVQDARDAAFQVFPQYGTEAQWLNQTYGSEAPYPTQANYTAVGMYFHHNLIDESSTVTQATCDTEADVNEGFYIGKRDDTKPFINDVEIAYNITKDTCLESYQVESVSPTAPICSIHDNYSSNSAIDQDAATYPSQSGAVRVKEGSTCDVFNNIIVNANAYGILITGANGDSESRIYNNIIVNSGRCTPSIGNCATTAGAIHTGTGQAGDQRNGLLIAHNTIINPANEMGIFLATGTLNVDMINNLIVGANTSYSFQSGAGHSVLPSQSATIFGSTTGLNFVQTSNGQNASYYEPGTGSTAIDRSANNAGIGNDIENKPRPFNQSYDLGAYESGGGAIPTNTPGPTPTFTPTPTPTATPTPSSLTLQPGTTGVDTGVQENASNTVLGQDTTLSIRNNTVSRRRALIRFDLSGVPNGATITAATLTLYNSSAPATNRTFDIHKLLVATNNWTEGSTWNYEIPTTEKWPGDTGSTGGTDGGASVAGTDYNATAIGAISYASSTAAGTAHAASLTVSAVQAALASDLLELYILTTDAETSAFDWFSSEHTTAGQRPKLVLTYTP